VMTMIMCPMVDIDIVWAGPSVVSWVLFFQSILGSYKSKTILNSYLSGMFNAHNQVNIGFYKKI